MTPQATQTGGDGERNAPWRADPRFAGDGYVLLDSLRVRPEDLRHDNAAALLAGLENPSDETYAGAAGRGVPAEIAGAGVSGAEEDPARVGGVAVRDDDWGWSNGGGRHDAQADRLEDYGDVEAYFRTRAQVWEEERRSEGHVEGRVEHRAEGREEGRVVGQRESLRRHAAMKFDSETAARLGAVLEGVTDQEAFDGVLAALLECDTPSDLLERATEVRRRTNGRNAPAGC